MCIRDRACRDARLIGWLQRASRSGARLASICSGSLVLAAAGLLLSLIHI